MVRILDYNGQEAERTVTVAGIRSLKNSGTRLSQVTAGSAEEAHAAEAAGIEMVVCMAKAVTAVRQGSTKLFVTAAIDFDGAVTPDDLLGAAFEALTNGADAVITARSMECVQRLADDDVPVMGHLGFVPKKSTLYGGVRAVGKTAAEAQDLWAEFRQLEEAGAFAVECELIPAPLMAEINRRTALATISLGSGPDADVVFLFMSDICGEGERKPRHARAYADLAGLYNRIMAERVRALTEFRADIASGSFPDDDEVSTLDEAELQTFLATLDES
ncbi:MAG: 3-methyl-2-oxobutanoate hydroxymethyltransferase [Acidimicrobiia bacterium]|nr:3-methyl-2-oxobutanoate hydroxymethyltransferase [Acidimicrobiia bacterium]MBT8249309.1 3-methyl-2-oxobutanoate hydroxymethyltransferase [Acidimicrobiia bacterium]NNL27481.1 ketopantoate hydroxymethyltransferase [Acidimicrobiia bacterium]